MAWHPNAGLTTTEGGVILANNQYEYAIGPNNNIDVRVAASDEDIAQILQVRLYEVENPETTTNRVFQVSSVVAGRTYYLIADFEAST